jgi:hypothetical protein
LKEGRELGTQQTNGGYFAQVSIVGILRKIVKHK